MATENKSKNNQRKNYLPHNKPVKKGAWPLRPGVEGFFITCDGGREYQASQEAIDVIDSFYDELVEGIESKDEQAEVPKKPMNKIIKFADSDSSDNESDDATNNDHAKDENDVQTGEEKDKIVLAAGADGSGESAPEIKDNNAQLKNGDSDESAPEIKDNQAQQKNDDEAATEIKDNQAQEKNEKNEKPENDDKKEAEAAEPPAKRQCVEADAPSKKLPIFRGGMFLLRVLPVEASCYTSDEEIKRAIKPVIEKYFPVETENPRKFSVLYDSRANTGVDRAKVIDAVAKSVPSLHKVDLANPDISIVVQVVKFYDELVEGIESKDEQAEVPKKPMNKIIKFADSDSSDNESDDATNNDHAKDENDVQTGEEKDKIVLAAGADGSGESAPEIKDNNAQLKNGDCDESAPEIKDNQAQQKNDDEAATEIKDNQAQEKNEKNEKPENDDKKEAEAAEPPAKRLCVEVKNCLYLGEEC